MNSTLGDKRLKCFFEAVDAGSIRSAADRLLLEPSVVSRQIQQLEAELGVRLLDRRGRGVHLTAAGEVMIEHCHERWGLERALREKLMDLEGLRRGELRVALSEGFLDEFLEGVLQPFAARYPNVVIKLTLLTASEVVRMVASDEAHVGITLHAQPDNRVRVLKERSQPIFAVIGAGHVLSRRRTPVSLADMVEWPVVLSTPGSGLRALIDDAAFVEKIDIEPRFSANSIAALKWFVAVNDVVTFLPDITVIRELAQGTLAVLQTSNPVLCSACAHIVVRRGRRYSSAMSALVDLMDECAYFTS